MTSLTINIHDDLASLLEREARDRQIAPEVLASAWLEEHAVEAAAMDGLPLTSEELEGIKQGLDDIANGRVYTHEELLSQLAEWRNE